MSGARSPTNALQEYVSDCAGEGGRPATTAITTTAAATSPVSRCARAIGARWRAHLQGGKEVQELRQSFSTSSHF